MCEAISAFIADVRFASGSVAVASSRTAFINSINSGRKTAPLVPIAVSLLATPPFYFDATIWGVSVHYRTNLKLFDGGRCSLRCSKDAPTFPRHLQGPNACPCATARPLSTPARPLLSRLAPSENPSTWERRRASAKLSQRNLREHRAKISTSAAS